MMVSSIRHSGRRAKRGDPESISTIGGYGFRVRDFVAPRNDSGVFFSRLLELHECLPLAVANAPQTAL